MSLSATRGLVRVSSNPQCELQAAMAVESVREPEFYRRVTGSEYPREYGERVSARRRGTKFEANLHQNDAALLRKALAPLFCYDPEGMRVRNFEDELPGARASVRAARLSRTRRLLADLAAGRDVPHLLIQPQLALSVLDNRSIFISPDFMVLDPRVQVYVPGDEKSFIVREGVADSADLYLSRRQVAAQVLALRSEGSRFGLQDRITDRGLFVLATPFGLTPGEAFEDPLAGEVVAIEKAMRAFRSVDQRLRDLRHLTQVSLENLVDDLGFNYEQSCVGRCVMADFCKNRCAGTAVSLGDAATDLVGADFPVDRIVALAAGARPANAREAELARSLRDATQVLRDLLDTDALRRMTA